MMDTEGQLRDTTHNFIIDISKIFLDRIKHEHNLGVVPEINEHAINLVCRYISEFCGSHIEDMKFIFDETIWNDSNRGDLVEFRIQLRRCRNETLVYRLYISGGINQVAQKYVGSTFNLVKF